MDSLLVGASKRLDELGIALHADGDAALTLERRGQKQTYVLEVKHAVSPQDVRLRGSTSAAVLLVTERVTERQADSLRQHGVNYVDLAGNAYLELGDSLIDVRGRRPAPVSTTKNRSWNLFSPRRAQVACALLAWPSLTEGNVRELAQVSGVSTGLAHGTIDLLDGAGLLPRATTDRDRRRRLLDAWTLAFPSSLAAALELKTFHGQPELLKGNVSTGVTLFVSGEWAVPDQIRATTLTLYVESLETDLIVKNRWRKDGEANVFVRQKFWRSPLTEEAPPENTVEAAPWPLIYADLMSSGDPRQRAVAQEWVEPYVG